MDLIRVLVTTLQTVTHEFRPDGVLTDAAGNVTVTVRRLDGTEVVTGTAGHPGVGKYTFAPPAQATVDTMTMDWTGSFGGATVTVRDVVEVVGGFLFGLTQAREDTGLSPVTYPDADIVAARIGTEQECEDICGQAFVPRFMRIRLHGSGTDELVMPDINLRAVRALTIGGTAADPAAAVPSPEGVLYRDEVWPRGRGNVIVEYEHGLDMPPLGIREASVLRLRSRMQQNTTSVPYRAISWQSGEGGTYRLSTPGKTRTGMPDVDAAYERYTVPMVKASF